jgi:hypothetical protein
MVHWKHVLISMVTILKSSWIDCDEDI